MDMKTIPIQWYQLAPGFAVTFATEGRFISFARGLHITMWANGAAISPPVIDLRSSHDKALVQVVTEYLETAARRVADKFPQVGTLHAVIFNIESSKPPWPIVDDRGSTVGFFDNEYTDMGLSLGYSEAQARPGFRYLDIRDLRIQLPHEVTVLPERTPSRYERPPVI